MSALSSVRRPLPRSWTCAVLVVVVLTALVLIANMPRMHVYLKHWGSTSPRIAMPYAALSPDMDEKALRAAMPSLPLRCISEDKARNGLGDRVCYASLDAADDAPALTAAFFFDGGRLAQGVVHVPWWGHHAVASALVAKLGRPEAIQEQRVKGARLIQWGVANGIVVINRDPGWDPLGWSAVFWMPRPPGARPAAR
jgi:hypothetical protein